MAARRLASRQASRRTHRPIGRIAPFSSAISMNSPGDDQAALGMLPADERLDAGQARRRAGRRSAGTRAAAGRARRRAGAGRRARGARGSPRACPGRRSRTRPCRWPWPCTSRRRRCGRRRRRVSVASRALAMPMLAVTVTWSLADDVRRPQLADEALGHRQRPLEVRRVVGQDRELVAAEASDEVAVPDGGGDPLGDGLRGARRRRRGRACR